MISYQLTQMIHHQTHGQNYSFNASERKIVTESDYFNLFTMCSTLSFLLYNIYIYECV